ncbi:MAG: response regulator transcription factor [Thermodesulfobacteria bacterium]|nr:response regulator transcription factor [Thermodesulfobacteriota bacterium]
MRCIIVDDEAPARQELCYLLSKYKNLEIVGEADRAAKAIELIGRLKPDVVFLDIQMPMGDGFSVVRAKNGGRVPLFVFVTAYDSYAVKAFDVEAVDYLLKPIDEKRLDATIKRLRDRLEGKNSSPAPRPGEEAASEQPNMGLDPRDVRIVVEKNGRMQLVAPEDIIYFSVQDGKVKAHLFDEQATVHGVSSLDALERRLRNLPFFRAHRSVLVNLHHIQEFSPWFNGKYNLVMNDQDRSELFVSRKRVRGFKERIGI